MSLTTGECGARVIEKRINQRGIVTFYKLEVFHHGLNEVRTVGDRDYDVVERKAAALLARWNEKWERIQALEDARQQKQSSKDEAESETSAAVAALASLATMLRDGVRKPARVDWNALKNTAPFSFGDTDKYPMVEFGAGNQPVRAKVFNAPERPIATSSKYTPILTLLDRIWVPSRRKKQEAAIALLEQDLARWRAAVQENHERRDLAEQMFEIFPIHRC
jgi:hypothetical protein